MLRKEDNSRLDEYIAILLLWMDIIHNKVIMKDLDKL